MNHYQQLTFTCAADQASLLSEWLSEQDAILAVSLLDAEDQPIYEPTLDAITLWAKVEVEVLLSDDYRVEPLLIAITAQFGALPAYRLERLEERDWVTETQNQFPPQCFKERLWLYPAWETVPDDLSPVLRLSPGLAFGTGTHPTTRLCLTWLAEHIHGTETVIDFGCGSGILALAALTLGATHVSGIDLDPQALDASRSNAELNAIIDSQLPLFLPEAFKPNAQVDILIANILAQPIISLAAKFHSFVKPGGMIVLSGILTEQMTSVISAYHDYAALTCYGSEGDWCALAGVRYCSDTANNSR